MSAALHVRGLVKEFPTRRGRTRVLDGINLEVAAGEFVCVVGVNGSGKSTLLSLIAGLLQPTAGLLQLNGSPITGPGPERGLVFQAPSLYPWRTVERNVAFGLELLGVPRAERRARVSWYLEVMGLKPFTQSLPKQLSGGQRQRAAIARALACEPQLLLLDEPFGALDVQTKEDMQVFLREVWTRTGTTVIMVTHDVEEAVFLAQRVVVLASDPGRIADNIPVDLPPDRPLEVKRDPRFLRLRSRVEDMVRAQHHNHLQGPVDAAQQGQHPREGVLVEQLDDPLQVPVLPQRPAGGRDDA